jgi:hypothetical protein
MNHPAKSRFAPLASAALAIAPALAFAGPDSKEVIPEIAPAPVSPWDFRVTPYGWLTGLDGTTGAGGITTDVDAPFFTDILDNIKMAAALQFEARRDKWGVIVDGFYADLGADGSPPGPIYQSISVDLRQFIGQAEITYRIYESPKAFVDVFAGARYNGMWLDLGATINSTGVSTLTANASSAITSSVDSEAQAIVEPRVQQYQSAAAVDRIAIENDVKTAVENDANARLRQKVERQLVEIRRTNGLGPEIIVLDRVSRAVARETTALAGATAELKVAQLRASVNPALQGDVVSARNKVAAADKNLASALAAQVTKALPTKISANKQWVDPIIGVRGQYNFNDKWYLAGNTDIGGFGVSSDLTWSVEAVLGYNFTRNVSAELGYRYLYTDYQDGGFIFDMAQAGIYTGVNIRF